MECIYTWRENGYIASDLLPVVNAQGFMEIDEQISQLSNLGVEVLFWFVPKARNQVAHELAVWALNLEKEEKAEW